MKRRVRIHPAPSPVATAGWPLLATLASALGIALAAAAPDAWLALLPIVGAVAGLATTATLVVATGWARHWRGLAQARSLLRAAGDQ